MPFPFPHTCALAALLPVLVKAHTFWRFAAVLYSARGGRIASYASARRPIKPTLGTTPFFVQKSDLHKYSPEMGIVSATLCSGAFVQSRFRVRSSGEKLYPSRAYSGVHNYSALR